MSEDAQNPAATPEAPAQTPTDATPAPEVETIDWKAKAREWERRSKENKTAADELAAIRDSQKSAEQKTAEALAAAQSEAGTFRAQALRYEVAAAKGLDLTLASRLTGSTKEELEADADALMALIPKVPEAPPALPVGPTVPGQQPGGSNPATLVTQSDIDALGAAGKFDEINRLRREGRLSHLL